MFVTVSKNGQVLIPSSLRARLGICAGMRLEILEENGTIRMLVEPQRKSMTAQACIGIAGYAGPRVEVSKMDPVRFVGKQ